MLKNNVGIKAFDAYLPPIEIDQSEIVSLAQGNLATAQSLGVKQKRLPQSSDDTLTLAVETVMQLKAKANTPKIGALYLGTETPVYSVGNTAAAIAHFCDIDGQDLKTADLEFACRAGTLAMINAIGHVQSFDSDAIAVASDIAKGAPGDVLAMTTGAGAASFLLSQSTDDAVAVITKVYSYTQRRSDFWRGQGEEYPHHGGRYSNDSYTEVLTTAITQFCEAHNTDIADYDHVILHQPNQKLPTTLAKSLGISSAQLSAGLCFSRTGNLYAAMTPFSLAQVLSEAGPNEKILMASYGSGAGSDVLEIETTELLPEYQSQYPTNFFTKLEN